MSELSVLVADDNEEFLDLVSTTIKGIDRDINVKCVNNGYLALKQIKEKFFDLLITDFEMPVMTGVDLVRSLKTVRMPHVPKDVLMLSAYVEEGESEDDDLQNISYMPKDQFVENFSQYITDEIKLLEKRNTDNVYKELESKGEIDVSHVSNLRVDIVGDSVATMAFPVSLSLDGMRVESHASIATLPKDISFDCIISLPTKEVVTVKSKISNDLSLDTELERIDFISLSLTARETLSEYLSALSK